MKPTDPLWLTQELARELLDYDQETGIFTWRSAPNGAVRAGCRAGQVLPSGYRSIAIRRKGVMEHRLAWLMVTGAWPAGNVDHMNRSKADNRFTNLRDVTQSQNMHNTRRQRAPASGEEGLGYSNGSWWARISFQSEEIYLGSHPDKEVMRLTRGLAKDRALKGMRPLAAKDRKFIDLDAEEFRDEPMLSELEHV